MTENEINIHCDILRSAVINEIGDIPEVSQQVIIAAAAIELLRGFLTDINQIADVMAAWRGSKS
jgi:hypothetical protein